DKKSAVAPAADREFRLRSIFVVDQVLRRGDEIVEHVLLGVEHSGFVPFLAVLAAAAQVRDRENSSHLHPNQTRWSKARRLGNVESAVAVEVGRILAVALDSLFVGEEHRHARAIAAFEKDLLGRVGVGIKFYFRFENQFASAFVEIVTENFRGRGVTGERVKRLAIFALAGESGGGSDSGQGDLAIARAVELEQSHYAMRVVQIERDETLAHAADRFEFVFRLRADFVDLRGG